MLSIPLTMQLEHLNSLIHLRYKNVAVVVKNVASLKTFPLDFTNIMCLSTIYKYIKRPTYLSSISFIEFVTNYAIVNFRGKRIFFTYNSFCGL